MQARDNFQRWVAITPSDTIDIGETTADDGKARAFTTAYLSIRRTTSE